MEYILVLLAAAARILPHPPNMTPVAAIALFGGIFLSRRFALLYPLMIMAASDLILYALLGVPRFLPEGLFVYGSFLITGCLGLWCRKHLKIGLLYLICLVSSLQFFLLTNFGTWLMSGLYPRTTAGLLQCYTLAVPFFKNTLLGDLFWFSLLLGAYHLVHRRVPLRQRLTS